MWKIILRSVLGLAAGIAVYSIASEGAFELGRLLFFLAWGIGMGNSFSFNLMLMGRVFNWATNLSILSFLSFGSGIFGIVALVVLLGVVLSVGWVYGWYVLVRDLISEFA